MVIRIALQKRSGVNQISVEMIGDRKVFSASVKERKGRISDRRCRYEAVDSFFPKAEGHW